MNFCKHNDRFIPWPLQIQLQILCLLLLMMTFIAVADEKFVTRKGGDSWTVQLNWKPVPEVDKYHVQVSRTKGFAKVVTEGDTKNPNWKWVYRPGMENSKGRLFYRVASVGDDGQMGEYSEPTPIPIPPEILARKEEVKKPEPPKPQPIKEPIKEIVKEQVKEPVKESIKETVAVSEFWNFWKKHAYFDAWFAGSSSRITAQSSAAVPTLVQFDGGVTAGYLLGGRWNFLIGATSDYRRINQRSDVSAGNASGTRWNKISPTLGYYGHGFAIKADYQLSGDYLLKSGAFRNESVTYLLPKGWRFTVLHLLWWRLFGGGFIERVSFRDLKVGDMTIQLASPLILWQYGLSINIIL